MSLPPLALQYRRVLRKIRLEFDWDTYVRASYQVKNTPSGELRICCFHCNENKFKLYVNPAKKQFHCFKCDFSSGEYDVFDFVAKTENLSRFVAIKKLYREYAATTPIEDMELVEELEDLLKNSLAADKAPKPLRILKKLPDGVLPLEADVTPENAPFWRYLTDRGLYEDEVLGMSMHYVPDESLHIVDSKGNFRSDIGRRIVIPIYGGDHDLVSWQARTINKDYPKQMKYVFAPEADATRTVWPFVKPTSNKAVIVEGIFDCLAVRRVTGVNAYATLSKHISRDQIKVLKEWGIDELVIFWDRRDSLKEIKAAVPELLMHFKKVFVLDMKDWPKNKDAGDTLADPEGVAKLTSVLQNEVDTYDSLDYTKWMLSF